MSALTTDKELAEQFGISLGKFHELRRRNGWPAVRLGRFAWRFTDEQVDQIVRMQTETPETGATQQTKVPGQTARSAARRRSA